ncbi:MAG: Ig-like domain-containing protein [Clostridia bacterium]|nr:Ig-like domain-containing protein [Clostridia bacterium]
MILSGETDALQPTETLALSVSVEPETASSLVTWESLDERVATIDENGVVTAKRPGSVYIRAYAKDNKSVRGQIRLTVRYLKAPASLSLPFNEYTLYVGDSFLIAPVIEPIDASRIIQYASSDPSIASVDETGAVAALSYGQCTITVKSAANPKLTERILLTVKDPRIPDKIIAHPSYLRLEPSNFRDVSLLILPETMNAELVWSSNNEDVAAVDQNGRVTAMGEGECTIFCQSVHTNQVCAKIPVTVKYGKEIRSLSLDEHEIKIPRHETASVAIEKTPADAGNAIACTYSNPGICEMDEYGTIKALRRGETIVRVYSFENPDLFDEIKVIVEDDLSPLSAVSDISLKPVLKPGETVAPVITFLPEGASQPCTWTSTNPEIASVDEHGVIYAHSPGVSKIRAVNKYETAVFVEFYVTVEPDEYTLVMPERRTDKSGLEENMRLIDNVRQSAQKMLLKEYEAGEIALEEYERRSEVVDSAFEMYAFPWMVEAVQRYWNDDNSENGAKDFKPGIMYYGLPYISGGNSDRTYDVKRALEQERYLPSSDGDYYIFNRNHELNNGLYVGSDCSSFVSLAYFGNVMYNGEKVKTSTLYYDNRFITTDDPENLLAGDILVRHSIHVVMFLYWADEAHTQAVFIEQGGSEDAINTISTSVYTVSDYMNKYYHIRTPFYR